MATTSIDRTVGRWAEGQASGHVETAPQYLVTVGLRLTALVVLPLAFWTAVVAVIF